MIENYRFQNKFGRAKIFISGFWVLLILGSLATTQLYFVSHHNKTTYFFIAYISLVYLYSLVFNILRIVNLYTRVRILDDNLMMVTTLLNEICAVFSLIWVGFSEHLWTDVVFYTMLIVITMSLLTCATYFGLAFPSKKKIPIVRIKMKFMFISLIPYFLIFIVNISLYMFFNWYPPTLVFVIVPLVLMYPLVLLVNKFYK